MKSMNQQYPMKYLSRYYLLLLLGEPRKNSQNLTAEQGQGYEFLRELR